MKIKEERNRPTRKGYTIGGKVRFFTRGTNVREQRGKFRTKSGGVRDEGGYRTFSTGKKNRGITVVDGTENAGGQTATMGTKRLRSAQNVSRLGGRGGQRAGLKPQQGEAT